MNVVARATRRMGRELTKFTRLRKARREGLVYTPPNFLYRPTLTPDSVVIDAGCSYEADFSIGLMRRHGVRAFGVDPTRKHREALRLLEIRHPGRFVHVPCALAAVDGMLTFHESRVNESGSLLTDHVNVIQDETTSYDVEAIRLGSLLKRLGVETVDILKLDLEGAEYELLAGLTSDDLQPFRQVFVEFHHHAVSHFGEADTQSLVGRIAGFGFRDFSLDDHNYLFYRDF
ncbi:MAG TPA: FkbM family methyltransferase [Vicinamibacterales bacterium]